MLSFLAVHEDRDPSSFNEWSGIWIQQVECWIHEVVANQPSPGNTISPSSMYNHYFLKLNTSIDSILIKANGLVERFNQTIQGMLAKFVQDKDTWESYLDTCIYAYNTSRHESSLDTLMFGCKAVIPVDLENDREYNQRLSAMDVIQISFRRYRKRRRGWRRQKQTSPVLSRSRRCMIASTTSMRCML